ncbi:MAG: LamG domain-containing protein, partial [Sedimentisphaerales bacterium]|nr:LamG domain-containing protein [Sedimentisphaerales bacterium]
PDYDAVRPWLALADTSTNTHLVKYGDFGENIINIQVANWHRWDISLLEYENAGVNLASLSRVTIGVGGTAYTGQSKESEGTIWIDDILLYPPRCRPDVSVQTGDFTEDCTVDSYDLDIMVTDWLLIDGENPTENRPATLTGFPDATSHWIEDSAVGTGAIDINEGYNIDVTDPRLNGLASMSITAWVKQTIDNEWAGIVSSREDIGCGDDATELGIYGGEWGGPDGLGYDWSCGDEDWEWDAFLDVPTDGTWTFVAISVDPTGGSLYMRPAGGALQTGLRNVGEHPLQQNFSNGFAIGNDDKPESTYFAGAIDDVRIYAYALDFTDVNNLAYQTAEPDPAPVYRYEFDETTGYTAADTGTPTIVYSPVPSVANLADPEPKLERAVNYVDYAILADSWLEEFLWPY